MKKEFTKKQLQQSFDDGIGAGKIGVEALIKEVYEKHAKEIADIEVAVEERKEAYLLEIEEFKKQIDEQTKKVDTINQTATERIKLLQVNCQEFAVVIKMLARNI